MAKFMDVHSGFYGVTAEQLDEAHGQFLQRKAKDVGNRGNSYGRTQSRRQLIPSSRCARFQAIPACGIRQHWHSTSAAR